MGVRADVRDEVRKETVTKIHGQPTNKDLTILEKELIAILANIPTTLGGGNHGHAGILMDPARYLITAGVPFVNPANPGNYPASSRSRRKRSSRSASESRSTTQRGSKRIRDVPRSHTSDQRHHHGSSRPRILT